jgi:hypothetical protein
VGAAPVSGEIDREHAVAGALEALGQQPPRPRSMAHAVNENERPHRSVEGGVSTLRLRDVDRSTEVP